MQIAGSHCAICHQNVALVREGVACRKCELVFHRSCAVDNMCRQCGQILITGQKAHAIPSTADRVAALRPTSVTLLGRLAYVGAALSIIRILGGLSQSADVIDQVLVVFDGVLSALLTAWLGWGLLGGREWARRLYLWATPVIVVATLVVADGSIARQGLGWLRAAIGLGFYIPFAFALTRAKSKAFFATVSGMNNSAVV